MGSRESQERRDIGVGKVFKHLLLAIAGSAALASSLVLLDTWKAGDRFVEALRNIVTPSQPEPKIDPRAVVVRQIRGASELTTAIFAMETVVPASRDRTLGGYTIGKTTLLYIAYGEVRAGVDLSQLSPDNIQVTGETISLQLPPPQILDSKIDVTRSKVYDYDRGFLGLGPDAAPELQELAQQETLKRIVNTACTEGVLQEASDRAELAVNQLLTTAGYSAFTVETQSPDPDACTLSVSEPQTLEPARQLDHSSQF